ncbi:hypothetical protein [Rhodococcus artemisiae]|uniref:Uncharacterized protein n=1 Tax=Rhodococcus artemisiae TaxID=714159 RepID=A0ABU7LJW9_9NOCA|nr:hypothetical protein [Rhodococcus artemisiae]MEE2061838.1 hypothetical protein [Rhodococcus artemisiae]
MAHNETDQQFEGFDFHRDVVGDDLVVDGVVYDSHIWKEDGAGGVMRRSEAARDLEPTSQEIATDEILRRADAVAGDFAALARNISTGPNISELLAATRSCCATPRNGTCSPRVSRRSSAPRLRTPDDPGAGHGPAPVS